MDAQRTIGEVPIRRFHRADKRTWSLLDEHGVLLGSLVRPSWFSQRVELLVASGIYEVRALRSLSSAIALFSGSVPLMVARSKWRNTDVCASDGTLRFRILRKGWFGSTYRIVDAQGIERHELRTRMSWKRFDREHELVPVGGPSLEPIDLLFILQVITTQQDRAAAAA